MITLLTVNVAMTFVAPQHRWGGNENLPVGLHKDGTFANPTLDWGERIDDDALVALSRADVIIQDLIYTPNEHSERLRVGRTGDPDRDHWLLGAAGVCSWCSTPATTVGTAGPSAAIQEVRDTRDPRAVETLAQADFVHLFANQMGAPLG